MTGRVGLTLAALATLAAASAPAARAQLMDNKIYTLVRFDRLEYNRTGDTNPLRWDMIAWAGGDITRFWIKAEGFKATEGTRDELEVQGLYSRLIAPFWEFQLGAQVDTRRDALTDGTRVQAVVGLEGWPRIGSSWSRRCSGVRTAMSPPSSRERTTCS